LQGRTDLDLLVARRDAPAFHRIAAELGFREVRAEGWRFYPAMTDYLGYDPAAGVIHHLHVHYELLMGARYVKSLRLPFEDECLSSVVHLDGVPVAAPEFEWILLVIRFSLKAGSEGRWMSPSRLLRLNVFEPFTEEVRWLAGRVDRQRLIEWLDRPSMKFLPSAEFIAALEDFTRLRVASRRRIRRSVNHLHRYRRVPRWFLYRWRELRMYYDRFARQGSGKTLANGGLTLAFVGADGSGKSSLAQAIREALGKYLSVRSEHLGANYEYRTWRIRWFYVTWYPYLVAQRLLRTTFPSWSGLARAVASWEALHDYLLALDKLHKYRRGMRAAANGSVVVFDRFPLFPGAGDGDYFHRPRQVRSGIVERFRRKERACFDRMIPPDVMFYLEVDPQTAYSRKLTDTPHHPDMVEAKCKAFRDYFERHKEDRTIHVMPVGSTIAERQRMVIEMLFGPQKT